MGKIRSSEAQIGGPKGQALIEKEKWEYYYGSLPFMEEDEGVRNFNAELVGRVMRLLPSGGRILEAGCGGGWQSLALARTGGFQVSLMDFAEPALSHARRLFDRENVPADFISGDVLAPGQPEFDLVFNAGVLEHYNFEQQVAFLRGMASRSRRYVLVLVPNSACYWYWISRVQNAARGNWPFGKEAPAADLSKVFQAAGLQFHGQAFMAEAWAESFIRQQADMSDPLRNQILTIHRSPLIPQAQKSYLIGALGSISSETASTSQHWSRCDEREAQFAELNATVADALSLRIGAEHEIRQLTADLSNKEESLAENEKLLRERIEEIGRLNSVVADQEVEIQRLSNEVAMRVGSDQYARNFQEHEEVRALIALGIKNYETRLEHELSVYRNQRAWTLMLLARKAYPLLASGGARAKLALVKMACKLLLRQPVDLGDAELRFPTLANYVPERTFASTQQSPAPSTKTAVATRQVSAGIPSQSKYDVIILAIIDFDFRFQRPQQIAAQLAKNGHRVWWISPTRFLPVSSDLPYQLTKLRDNLWEVHLRGRQPDIYMGELESDIESSLLDSLRCLYRDLAIAESCALLQLPFWRRLGKSLREEFGSRLLYDCMDDWDTFVNMGGFNVSEEKSLVRECDLLIVTGKELIDKFEGQGLKPLLARNAVDFDFFQKAGPNSLLQGVRKPIIGYFGAIADWMDLDLTYEVAKLRPDYSFVLIGQVFGRDVSHLEALPNVKLLGSKNYPDIPAYLYHFDVCIIPFLLNQVTKATDPVKLYEYLSLGKPVVSTDMAELRQCADLVYIGKDAKDFACKLDFALQETDPGLKEKRINFAASNTWRKRVESIDAAIEPLFPFISIVVVTYNSEVFVAPCLDSILRNTACPQYEVIVADNGSKDGTREILERYAAANSRIRVIHMPTNAGFAGANNVAIRQARGEYIVLLNADAMVTPGWTERLIRPIREDSSIGMVSPVTNFAGNEIKINTPYRNDQEMEEFALRLAREEYRNLLDIPMAPLFCTMIPKKVWNTVGELDEAFQIGMFEDDDYSMRVKKTGLRIVAAEDCFVHHFGQGSFSQLTSEAYNKLFEQNRRRYEEKWGTWQPPKTRPNVRPAFEETRFSPAEFVSVKDSGPERRRAAQA